MSKDKQVVIKEDVALERIIKVCTKCSIEKQGTFFAKERCTYESK